MTHLVLDSSPLSLLSSPAQSPETVTITNWAKSCLASGHKIYVPEIIDYELRRELIRSNKTASIAKLDALKAAFRYLPLSTAAMLEAAELWAQSRNSGAPTGDPKKTGRGRYPRRAGTNASFAANGHFNRNHQRRPPFPLPARLALEQLHAVET